MTKKAHYQTEILCLLDLNDFKGLKQYILENSNLPGRMANLTLISAIADSFSKNFSLSNSWYPVLIEWLDLEANGNDAETVLVLTALESLGSLYEHCDNQQRTEIAQKLHASLNDERWRVREIVTESYKRIGLDSYDLLVELFQSIITNDLTPLEIRGILATLAHPILLQTPQQLGFAQKILEISFDYYLDFNAEKFTKEDKKVLRKGLSFAPSVIINKTPDTGFNYLKMLVEKNNKDLTRIVKENLKKKRLASEYPTEVVNLLNIIDEQKVRNEKPK